MGVTVNNTSVTAAFGTTNSWNSFGIVNVDVLLSFWSNNYTRQQGLLKF